jgi:hypothetical protein
LLDEFAAALGITRRKGGRMAEDVEGRFILHPAAAGNMRRSEREGREAGVVERWHSEEKR